jgi:hypothetical protein
MLSTRRPGPSIPPRNHGANTFTSFPRMTIEHVSHNMDVFKGGFVELHVEFAEDCGDY